MWTTSRLPLERIARFDREIRAGRYPNANTLARELEVHPRTIHRDITFLRDRLGAPLAYDPVRHGFYYTDATYRLPAVTLTEAELLTMVLARSVLRQYSGTPYALQLNQALHKLRQALAEETTIELDQLDAVLSLHVAAPPPIDAERFTQILSAIRNRDRLAIRYRDRHQQATRREIDPWHIAAVGGAWYLVAFCHLRQERRMFVLDRILSIGTTGESFVPDPKFSIHEFLATALTVFRGNPENSYQIVLRLRGVAATTLRERPLHPTQRSETAPDGSLHVSMELSHLQEVERLALSWGSHCEVLAPDELRDRVAAELRSALGHYNS